MVTFGAVDVSFGLSVEDGVFWSPILFARSALAFSISALDGARLVVTFGAEEFPNDVDLLGVDFLLLPHELDLLGVDFLLLPHELRDDELREDPPLRDLAMQSALTNDIPRIRAIKNFLIENSLVWFVC